MPNPQDLLQAKQTLSATLLRAGLRGGIVGMMATLSVDRAVATAGHNVHAVGIGRKVVEGVVTNDPCVRIYVVQKIAESLLPPRNRLPESINGISTDVIESPPAFILMATRRSRPRRAASKPAMATAAAPCTLDRRKRQRPICAGISAAHRDVTAGTIGYFCRSIRHGDDPSHILLLSNNHVFADVNQGRPGDDLYQPGPADGGIVGDHFADLSRFVPIQLGGTSPNRVDAAICRLRPDISYRAEVCSIGPVTGTARATEGMRVHKHGRTTGYTEGVVTDESYDALIGMDHSDPNIVALFENQIRIERVDPYPAIGLGGDSGSLVVMQAQAKAVGLYFAGPPGGIYGVANHMQDVLNELEIELL
ncbi:MAG: hypothetical protein ACRERE_22350 [Candidatus Entotheonellia bacterium]